MVTEFRYLPGAVYILENILAQRVKVGMTINDVALRLRDVNDLWLELKLTCQICGRHPLAKLSGLEMAMSSAAKSRLVPRHVVSGKACPGGNALPLEADLTLATAHLANLRLQLSNASGSEKGSITRRINILEKRITLRPQHVRGVGVWQVFSVYFTDCAELVESRTHEILKERLDRVAPLGEVFCCTATEAREAVEIAFSQLGVAHFATPRVQS